MLKLEKIIGIQKPTGKVRKHDSTLAVPECLNVCLDFDFDLVSFLMH